MTFTWYQQSMRQNVLYCIIPTDCVVQEQVSNQLLVVTKLWVAPTFCFWSYQEYLTADLCKYVFLYKNVERIFKHNKKHFINFQFAFKVKDSFLQNIQEFMWGKPLDFKTKLCLPTWLVSKLVTPSVLTILDLGMLIHSVLFYFR